VIHPIFEPIMRAISPHGANSECRATLHGRMGGAIRCELGAKHAGEHRGGNGVVFTSWAFDTSPSSDRSK
jgi:hypothetical protein